MDISKKFYQYAPAAHLLVTDEDAADFLQSQFTNELRPYEAGQCTYGLWLDVKGKVLADSVVLCEGSESFRVFSERCAGAAIAAHMERHIIADDVAIEQAAPGLVIEFGAPGAEALGLALPEQGRSIRFEGGTLFCARQGAYGLLSGSESEANALLARLSSAGFTPLTVAERGLARIAAGVVQVPEEIGAADLPGEGGLERDAVSFTKGCYLGQEVVARMHNVGQPQRGLFLVDGEGAAPEVPLALYNCDSKQVGELRTAYPKSVGRWRGVAILKIRFAGAGQTLRFGDAECVVGNRLREGRGND